MKLCIPTLDAQGLASELSEHFGEAPHLTLLDCERGQADALAPGRSGGRDCGRIGLLEGHGVDAVVVRGAIGRGALAALSGRGIPVLVTVGRRVSDVLDEARASGLRRLDAGETCAHHRRHGGGCDN
jgi:predicted Fe-Mo cluster-binding NifX family protein